MSAFDHVILLLSFVYALALTHLLSRIGALLVARERVRFSGLLAVGMANAILLVFANWLSLWDIRGLHGWDLFSITVQFLFAVALFFVCAVAAPAVEDDGSVDMEGFYWRNRRLFYSIVMVVVVLALIVNVTLLRTPNPALFFEENAATLPMIVVAGLPLATSARWAQWTAGLGLFAMMVGYTITFSGTLK
jgi:hypothetical protein